MSPLLGKYKDPNLTKSKIVLNTITFCCRFKKYMRSHVVYRTVFHSIYNVANTH